MAKITPARGVLKRGGNGGSYTTAGQYPQIVVGQFHLSAQGAAAGGPQMYRRAFTAHRCTAGKQQRTANKLHQGIAAGQAPLMLMYPIHHMGHTGGAAVGFYKMQNDTHQQNTAKRHQEMAGCGEGFKGFGAAAVQQGL